MYTTIQKFTESKIFLLFCSARTHFAKDDSQDIYNVTNHFF